MIPVKNEKQYSYRLIISLIPLFLYGSLRVDYGLDYNGYEAYFNSVKSGWSFDERNEIGYYYLNKYLPTFRSLLIVQSILLCTAYFYIFKRYVPAKYACLGFVVLYLNGPVTIFFMLSGIRNGIAMSLLILSTYFIYTRKIIFYAIFVFVAYLFHNSVIFVAPVAYFIGSRMRIDKRSMIVWLSVVILIAFISETNILNYINDFITSYYDRYSVYIENALYQENKPGILAAMFSFMVSIVLFLLFKDKSLNEKERMIISFTLLFLLSYTFGALNFRLTQYYAPYFIAGTVTVYSKGTNRILTQFYFVAIVAYMIYAFMLWFNNPYFSYDTYKSILFN